MGKFGQSVIDQKFSRLLVIDEEWRRQKTGELRHWAYCRCECDNRKWVRVYTLRNGDTQSCGCLHRERAITANLRHGFARHYRSRTEYTSWVHMKSRCDNSRNRKWPIYGGRGIKVCERWYQFENFLADMGAKPSLAHSIDRIDVNGNYEANNCRWATPLQQARNRRRYLNRIW